MAELSPIEISPLTKKHRRSVFDCGQRWLNNYLQQHAWRNQELGYGRSYVATTAEDSLQIEGFYTLSMSSILFSDLPDELAERVPKYPMPVAHMGCLAVSGSRQGQGLGALLLVDAFRRIVAAADVIGARALDVRAIDDAARDWYLRWGFKPFRDHPSHLYLPLETVRQVAAAT